MELEARIVKIERVSTKIVASGGIILGRLTLFTLSAYEFAKLVKYLVRTW